MGKLLKINDPIHSFLLFPEFLTKIVDSEEMQRLIRIRQLSGTNHVFPGANHTRFEHSLGVAYLAQKLSQNLISLHNVDLTKEDLHDCVVAALLHDIGHGPFSHNFESILGKNLGKNHEDFTLWIIQKSEIADILENLSFNPKYIAKIATGQNIAQLGKKAEILSQIISGAVNVDSMDYLLRDNYHCGTSGRSVDIDRLLLSMDVVSESILGIDIRALIALEGFLLSRISSFRTIYFHKTCRAFQLMLAEGMQILVEDNGLLEYASPVDYIKWDDYTLWSAMIENPNSRIILEKLKKRQFLKLCYESQLTMADNDINLEETREILHARSNIPIEHIYIDVPSSPNVPYNAVNQTRPNEIYTFKRVGSEKEPVRLEENSIFFEQFRGQLKLVRIYTWPEYRQKLIQVSKDVFESST